MSLWTDARDNIRNSFTVAWLGLSGEARAFAVGLALGFLCGATVVGFLAL